MSTLWRYFVKQEQHVIVTNSVSLMISHQTPDAMNIVFLVNRGLPVVIFRNIFQLLKDAPLLSEFG